MGEMLGGWLLGAYASGPYKQNTVSPSNSLLIFIIEKQDFPFLSVRKGKLNDMMKLFFFGVVIHCR